MLKKCLLWLFVWFVWLFTWFLYAESSTTVNCQWWNCNPSTYDFADWFDNIGFVWNSCDVTDPFTVRFNFPDLNDYCDVSFNTNCVLEWNYCDESWLYWNSNIISWWETYSFDIVDYNGVSCPEIDTWSILSGACDTNYCVQNDLCPTSSWSRSELMINNIVHEWKPLISINIPDNIYWDYTGDENWYYIFVWSWYNQEYIDSVLAINSYRPDNQDFTNIFVSWLTLIFPYIFVALLILFIWKLLKRIFK